MTLSTCEFCFEKLDLIDLEPAMNILSSHPLNAQHELPCPYCGATIRVVADNLVYYIARTDGTKDMIGMP